MYGSDQATMSEVKKNLGENYESQINTVFDSTAVSLTEKWNTTMGSLDGESTLAIDLAYAYLWLKWTRAR